MTDEPKLQKCRGICDRMLPSTREYFTTSKIHKDGLFPVCRDCRNLYYRDRNVAMKTGVPFGTYNGTYKKKPSIVGSSNRCGACGNETGNIVGDVDKATQRQYGYLCYRCNRVAQAVRDDDIDRVGKVAVYLKRARREI